MVFLFVLVRNFLINLFIFRILTGCYDNSVNIWTTHGKIVTSLKEHKNIVKAVSWIDKTDAGKGFISVSHDLTGIIWTYEAGKLF